MLNKIQLMVSIQSGKKVIALLNQMTILKDAHINIISSTSGGSKQASVNMVVMAQIIQHCMDYIERASNKVVKLDNGGIKLRKINSMV
jgi:hypothetical protein